MTVVVIHRVVELEGVSVTVGVGVVRWVMKSWEERDLGNMD